MWILVDFRVMCAGPFNIGLNETRLGIRPAFWLQEGYTSLFNSARRGEWAVTTGSMMDSKEALAVGWVDELSTDQGEAIQKCMDAIGKPIYYSMRSSCTSGKCVPLYYFRNPKQV